MKRANAAEAGMFKYFTGRPCTRGHLTLRYTKTGGCIACNNIAHQERSKKLREVVSVKQQGLTKVTLHVHPNDVKALTDYCEALATARRMS